jgi:hypothetical protein
VKSEKVAVRLSAKTLRSLKKADPRIAEYIRGYETHPDDPAEAIAMAEAWANGIEPGQWS